MPPNYEINQDVNRTINILDLNAIGLLFGYYSFLPGNIIEYVNNDVEIDILDLNIVAYRFVINW